MIFDRESIMLAGLYNLSVSSNIGQWRSNAAQSLKAIVKDKFDKMQNPSDCKSAKKLLCDLNKGCGFGCQMHHVMYCFTEAYFQDRLMMLKSSGWQYDSAGFETVFMPLSNRCQKLEEDVVSWDGTATF